jgi:arsenate reductase-like glutaredoxin family protein
MEDDGYYFKEDADIAHDKRDSKMTPATNDDLMQQIVEMHDDIVRLNNEHVEMRETLNFIKETLVKADTTITKVAAEVMPTINQLMESPMIKMLGGKKR